MNHAQQKYALARVDTIQRQRIEALEKSLKRPVKSITNAQRAKLLKDGKVKLAKDYDGSASTDVRWAFDFSEFECSGRPDPAVFEPAKAEIIAEATRVRDLIMLGDAAEALELLTKFSGGAAQ